MKALNVCEVNLKKGKTGDHFSVGLVQK